MSMRTALKKTDASMKQDKLLNKEETQNNMLEPLSLNPLQPMKIDLPLHISTED